MTKRRRDDGNACALADRVLARLRSVKKKHLLLDRLYQDFAEPKEAVDAALVELVRRGSVVRGRKDRLALAERLGLVAGRVAVGRGGRAVVVPDQPDAPIRIRADRLRPAMHGDRVLVEVEPYRSGGLRVGRLREVLEHGQQVLVGRIHHQRGGSPVLVPNDPRLQCLATVASGADRATTDQVVAARIIEYPTSFRDAVVAVEAVLGPYGTLAVEIEAVCRQLGVPLAFEKAVEAEAAAIAEPTDVDLPGRLDLRDRLVCTIDPSTAADHDDAVSIERVEDGYRLIVSIADVSHYVRPGSAIDQAALERGTSIYFPGRCIPMLPHRLSSGVASLKPAQDRLTLSVLMDIDAEGAVTATDFRRSVIRSRHRLSYEQAQALIDGAEPDPDTGELTRALTAMADCARLLTDQRRKRGAIDLDLPEAEVELDDQGRPTAVHRRERLTTHRLIEEFMIAANEAVARRLETLGVPFVYRIHERPDLDSMTDLSSRLSVLGLRLSREGTDVTPGALQAIVDRSRGRPTAQLVQAMVLRAMRQARYSAYKEIHFGLASTAYTHFTSPIRRYPDLIVHRALCASIDDAVSRSPSTAALDSVAGHCSGRERRAMEAERDVARAAAVLLMQHRVGETFTATVTGVERYGYFVEPESVFIEGFVPVGRLREYYDYVTERMELQSRTTNARIRIGDVQQVRLTAAELATRRLEFEPMDLT